MKVSLVQASWWGRAVQIGLAVAAVSCLTMVGVPAAMAQDDFDYKKLLEDSVDAPAGPQFLDVQNAITQFRNQKFEAARDLLIKAKKANPQLEPAEVMLARLFIAAGAGGPARAALERAVIEDGNDPQAFIMLGDIAFQQNRIAETALLFDRAYSLVQKYDRNAKRKQGMLIRAYAGLAAVAERSAGLVSDKDKNAQLRIAEKYLKDWVAADAKNVNALMRLARVQFQLEDAPSAYENFQTMYAIDQALAKDKRQNVARPEVNMAMLYQQDNLMPNAEKLMRLAVERAPEDLATRLAVGQWALNVGKFDDPVIGAAANAAAAEQIAVKTDQDLIQAQLLKGLVARYTGKYVEAETVFKSLVDRYPNSFAATNHLALSLIAQEDKAKRDKALDYAYLNQRSNADGKTPAGREAAATLAWVLYKIGREMEAERTMAAVLNTGSITTESAYYAAKVFGSRGRVDDAIRILKPTLDADKSFPNRAEAETLLDELEKKAAAAPANPKSGS